MQKQTWLPYPAPAPAPITELEWMGLAGAMPFLNGERPQYVALETPGDGFIQICAEGQGAEINYYDGDGPDHQGACWQFAAPLGSALMGAVIVTAAAELVVAYGPEEAARRLGWAQII